MFWLQPRHAALERLHLKVAEAELAVARAAPVASVPERPSQWQAATGQDGALFALPVGPRLLEIERCTDAKTLVIRILHNAAEGSTSLELNVVEPDAVRGLVECLNQAVHEAPVWRLLSVETRAGMSDGVSSAGQRVVLRYP
jgi:hypothetical protein